MGLANNHAGDHGDETLERVAQMLADEGVVPFGLDDRPVFEIVAKGQRIRILASLQSQQPMKYYGLK